MKAQIAVTARKFRILWTILMDGWADTLSAIARQKSYCAPVVSESRCVLEDSVMMQLMDGQQMTLTPAVLL